MATKSHLKRNQIGAKTPYLYQRIRTTLETAYYRNNVIRIHNLQEAYTIAKHSPGTIVTDLPIYRAHDLGLDDDAKVLIFNDGTITGRQAQARRLVDKNNIETFATILREAVFSSRDVTMYHATVIVGLHQDFMVKAHILIPEGYENTLYSWLLNFQLFSENMRLDYASSAVFEEGDILLYSDPDYYVDNFDEGLSLFDKDHNCAALLGMRYFGEHKKATLTMAWSIASRQGFTACHGGLKRFNLGQDKDFVMGVFGLSGSGKSTITHAKHLNKYDITVLHDDAFVINNNDLSTVALEPSYFDKVSDYPTDSDDNKFLLTLQNVGATIDSEGCIVPVTEDIRNGNGRAVKSVFWSDNRVNYLKEPVNAIFWIMKDDSLPPLLKINHPVLASILGATLATKRTSAEHGADTTKLAVVPYANPFRLYPLERDYTQFKHLFETQNVACYIINTGHFGDLKIPPKVTLNAIEMLVENSAKFESFMNLPAVDYLPIDGFLPDFTDAEYVAKFKDRIQKRVDYLHELAKEDQLPNEAIEQLKLLTR